MVKFETEILMKAESDKSAFTGQIGKYVNVSFSDEKINFFSDSQQSCLVSLLVVSIISVRDVRTFQNILVFIEHRVTKIYKLFL